MKNLITILLIMLAVQGIAQDLVIGYRVVTAREKYVAKFDVASLDKAQELFDIYFVGVCFDVAKSLEESDFFHISAEDKCYYIERKIITKKGRYRTIKRKEKPKIKRT